MKLSVPALFFPIKGFFIGMYFLAIVIPLLIHLLSSAFIFLFAGEHSEQQAIEG
jgi:hypothetical protein